MEGWTDGTRDLRRFGRRFQSLVARRRLKKRRKSKLISEAKVEKDALFRGILFCCAAVCCGLVGVMGKHNLTHQSGGQVELGVCLRPGLDHGAWMFGGSEPLAGASCLY